MGLPLATFSSLQFEPELRISDTEEWRRRHDREVMSLLPPTDLDVLLGYMWVVGRGMCWLRDMINLHPALPGGPKGTYRDVIWKLIRSEATESGVTMHLVTPELDRGPSISYCRYPIRGAGLDRAWQQMEMRLSREGSLDSIRAAEGEENLLFSLIREEGVARELPLITETIKLFAKQRIFVVMDRWVFSKEDGLLEDGYDLTEAVDLVVGGGRAANGH
jgi:phosphoribosylglycinamide formyltransferase-1